jgi:UDP-N-acetylmuramoylalanine--D-glutamate ligase
MQKINSLGLLKQHFDLDQQSKILIVGLGITGLSVARFLAQYDFDLTLVDSREQPPCKQTLLAKVASIKLICGRFSARDFNVATHLIVSPGLSLQEPLIQAALNRGARLLSDIDLFACVAAAPIVAISGANGKSTVTTMLGEMGKMAGKNTAIGGNLGTPALDLLAENVALYVLELSSFQLERSHILNATAATVLNVTADHLDRHSDMADYAAQKQKIFRGDGVMVLNADDAWVAAMYRADRETRYFSLIHSMGYHIASRNGVEWLVNESEDFIPCADLPLEGRHNYANALAALALGSAVGLSKIAMCQALRQFVGLEHRMQKVAVKHGITWINDSKATNIGACIAALQGYDNPVILIAGGQAKGADMAELRSTVEAKTQAVILMGVDALLIAQALRDSVALYFATSMQEAVSLAAQIASSGDTVLLSPACASLDQYKNYQDRGQQFAAAVLALV